MYPVFFKRRREFRLAALSLLIGTPAVLIPQIELSENWFSLAFAGFTALVVGSLLYLIQFDELARIWERRQKKRSSSTVALKGLQSGVVLGTPFFLFDVSYAAIFHSSFSYQYLVRPIGGIFFSAAMIATSVGLLLDWRNMPREVDLAAQQALQHVKGAGFEVDDSRLWVGIDSRLPSTGYTYPTGDDLVVLVKPWEVYATNEGGLLYTMVHEMCHVYLFQTKHSSHNPVIFHEVFDSFARHLPKKWQRKILRTVDGYPSEVLTEELSLKAFDPAKAEWAKGITEYFRRGDATRRSFTIGATRRMWRDALLILRTAYFAAQMERHQMTDATGMIPKARDILLSSLSPTASEAFNYFHSLFLTMSFDVTSNQYGKIMEEYLSRFVALAQGIS